jgi:hypothetical protein
MMIKKKMTIKAMIAMCVRVNFMPAPVFQPVYHLGGVLRTGNW